TPVAWTRQAYVAGTQPSHGRRSAGTAAARHAGICEGGGRTPMWTEFKTFLLKTNVLSLALAFIIGVALAAVVISLVNDIIMPPVGLALGGADFANMFIDLSGKHYPTLKAARDAGAPVIAYGNFINTVITFIIVAFVVFLLARALVKGTAKPSRLGIMRSRMMHDGSF